MSNCKFKIIQNILGGLERSWCPIRCQLPFLYTIRLLGGNPTQKLEEVARSKWGLKIKIPHKTLDSPGNIPLDPVGRGLYNRGANTW